VLYSMGDLHSANAEYSMSVRQKGNGKTAEQQSAAAEAATSRRNEGLTEELGSALRQAPVVKDTPRSGEATGKIDMRSTMSTEAEVTEQFSTPSNTEQLSTPSNTGPIYSVHDTDQLESETGTETIDSQHETGQFKQKTKPIVSPRSKKAE
jgi:hypothetical protein